MPVVKGGVWTNIEDEVLKAAVSKYGLNQWARVSSLLARKTPKQCKARWQEWLDPSIRKIEWSKEEDEKLLHLAKLMPTQWRTIAPIVGRTATQCLERYQRLLDDAEAREHSELALGGPDGGEASAPSADDVRRLRPGELDPDPESKPARPDTIDLDEDEKEMLSEARARLANTQGKKAKRKARERQLEESRRLALLQKRRELKNAGINLKIGRKKKGQMDYNADIPFEKPAAPGIYDTREELDQNDLEKEGYDPRKQQLSIKRKGEQEDETDRKRQKPDKSGPSAASQAAMKAGQNQRLREAEQNSKRRALVLPAPQVGDGELEDIIKMGLAGEQASQLAKSSENDTTRGLITNYSGLVGQTPIRTPRAAPEEDYIAAQARNLKAMTETQSSLLGGDNADIQDIPGSNGATGATPRRDPIFTPNPLATPYRGTNGVSKVGPGATPLRTPRDGFALNQDGTMVISSTPRELKLQERSAKSSLRAQLAALPKPKETDWELELPEEQQEYASTEHLSEEDAAARDARNAAIRKAAEAVEFKRKTQVIQRGLPLLPPVKQEILLKVVPDMDRSIKEAIVTEMAALIVDDRRAKSEVKGFDDELIKRARLEIQKELPQRTPLVDYEPDEDSDPAIFPLLNDAIEKLAESGMKAEAKLSKLHGGYQARDKGLRQKIIGAAKALDTARIQLQVSQIAQITEESAITSRLDQLREEVMIINKREREAQEYYRMQKEELDSLQPISNGVH